MKGKKGLASSLFVITIILFLFAVSSLLGTFLWNQFNDQIQAADNQTFTTQMKSDVDTVGDKIFGWPQKVFVALFVVLLIGYLISASTLPADEAVYVIIYIGILFVLSLFSMILANGWVYLTNFSLLSSTASTLTTIDFFMKFLPIITFITGLVGATIFYTKNKSNYGGGGFDDTRIGGEFQ